MAFFYEFLSVKKYIHNFTFPVIVQPHDWTNVIRFSFGSIEFWLINSYFVEKGKIDFLAHNYTKIQILIDENFATKFHDEMAIGLHVISSFSTFNGFSV